MQGRYDLALRPMWELRMMDAPGAKHRLNVASTSIIGIGGFLPWGIATALLCLAAGFVATRGSQWLIRHLPDPDPRLVGLSFGVPPYAPDEPGSRSERSTARDPFHGADFSRLLSLSDAPPAFSGFLDSQETDVLAADPRSARALHLLNVTTGDAETLFRNVRRTMPRIAGPPSGARLRLTTRIQPRPVDHRDDGMRVFQCALSERTFAVPASADVPVVVFEPGPGEDPPNRSALQAHDDGDIIALVLHPDILSAGPDVVLRAVSIVAARRILDGLDALRDAMVIDASLWNGSLDTKSWPDVPDWRDA
jgi:hypothetical protein